MLIRVGHATGQILVVLVTGTMAFPSKKHFIEALRKQHPEITTVVQNINGQHANMILGTREKVLFGRGFIEDELCGCRFKISAASFYQVNPVQTEKLYEQAMIYAALSGKEKVMDAYCGIGTIGIIASKRCANVQGVECNTIAVQDAKYNAQLNERRNIQFTAADASDWMVQAMKNGEKVDVVFMDPPRAGSTKRFLNALIQLAPTRIVYISCNPETLKRDLEILTQKGYRVCDITPFDLFPHTKHVETVCLLSKK